MSAPPDTLPAMVRVANEVPTSWADMFSRTYGGVAVVLAGSTAVFAINTYVVTSMLPSMLADIGGAPFVAWTATTFLVAAVIAAMLVTRLLAWRGPRGAMAVALGVFALGSIGCALSPDIGVLLASRVVQGFGGGLMGGLSMTLMRVALPPSLWPKAIALNSTMWGVGNLGGPALGGMFAQLGIWRWGFGSMAVVAGAIMLLAMVSLSGNDSQPRVEPLPVWSLLLLTSAAAALSLGAVTDGVWTILAILVGLSLAGVFVAVERRGPHRILSELVFNRGSRLRWCYLGVAGLTVGLTVETFVPLFGQELGGLSPLLAGFLGGALSVGWSVSQIASAFASSARADSWLRTSGSILFVVALGVTALFQRADASTGLVVWWAITLFVAGAGIGASWSRFAVAAMSSTADEEQGRKAAAGLTVVQSMISTFGSALAGVLVSLGGSSIALGAGLLYGGIAALGLAGVAASFLLTASADRHTNTAAAIRGKDL